MARPFTGKDGWERESSDSFTLTTALPSRPISSPDLLDDAAATSAFGEPPVRQRPMLPRIDKDPESLTLTVASPLAYQAENRVRQARSSMGAHGPVIGAPTVVGSYALSEPIATGGMARVHLGIRKDDDSRRVYAIKRLHAQFAHDEYITQMLLDEAAISTRVRHENVVTMYGAGIVGEDLILVMEYIAGLTIADLIRIVHPLKLPPRTLASIFAGALRGLHAAHEAVDEHGRSLQIVHRDVSPQNVHLGADGVARVLDFGIAKAEHRAQTTRVGELKGKMAYMAPEQLTGGAVDHRVDIRATGVVLWEALASAPLFHAENEAATMTRVLEGCRRPPSDLAEGIPPELDDVVMRALAMDPDDRYQTALEMAEALEDAFADNWPPSHEIAAWLTSVAADALCEQWNVRAKLLKTPGAKKPKPLPRPSLPPASQPLASLGSAPPVSRPRTPPPSARANIPIPSVPTNTQLMPFGGSEDRYAETAKLATRRRMEEHAYVERAEHDLPWQEQLQLFLERVPPAVKAITVFVVVLLVSLGVMYLVR